MEKTPTIPSAHRDTSSHLCVKAVEGLLQIISSKSNTSEMCRDLATVLEKALFAASRDSDMSKCQLCPLSDEINRTAERIQTKYNHTMKDRVLLWSIRLLKTIRGGYTEELVDDFQKLKHQVQTVVDDQGHRPNPSLKANMLGGANHVQITGATLNNTARNSIVDTSSRFVLVINYNSGIGLWGGIGLTLIAILVFRTF